MAQDILVGAQLTPEMISSGAALVSKLDTLKIQIKAALWLLLPDQHVWRLVIGSPEVRVLGPKAMYRKISRAVEKLPVTVVSISTSDISVVEDRDPLLVTLRQAIATGPGISGIRFSRNMINGLFIEDAYLYRV